MLHSCTKFHTLIFFLFILPCIRWIEGSWFSKWSSQKMSEGEKKEEKVPISEKLVSISPSSQLSWLESIQKKSEDELRLLEHGQLSLQKYESQGSECYRDAALLLKNGCKDLSVQQEEKIKYAVRLTLCEIATANIYVPQECAVEEPGVPCVEALSHNPQLWTSYSGYFREVTGMCFAVRNQIERELIEALFYNLSLSQLINNNMLRQHRLDLLELHVKEMNAWQLVHQEQLSLSNRTSNLMNATQKLETGMQVALHNLTTTLSLLQHIDQIQDQVKRQLHLWQEDTLLWMNQTYMQTQKTNGALVGVQKNMDSFLNQLTTLMDVQTQASVGIQQLGFAIQESKDRMDDLDKSQTLVVDKLNLLEAELDAYHQSAKEDLTKVSHGLKDLNAQMDSAKQSFGTLFELTQLFFNWKLMASVFVIPFFLFSKVYALIISIGSVFVLKTYSSYLPIWDNFQWNSSTFTKYLNVNKVIVTVLSFASLFVAILIYKFCPTKRASSSIKKPTISTMHYPSHAASYDKKIAAEEFLLNSKENNVPSRPQYKECRVHFVGNSRGKLREEKWQKMTEARFTFRFGSVFSTS